MTSSGTVRSGRARVRRHRDRGSYERAEIDAILDEAMICHVGACVEGSPWMIPTGYGRDGDWLYLHGAAGNHLLGAAGGADVVVCVTLLDGIVLARSSFNHSFNYRSVVIFGRAEEVTDPPAKARALEVIVEHILPGRSREARPPTGSELRQTRVVRVGLAEASAKVRSGPPVDAPADVDLPIWAGVLPLRTSAGPAVPDGRNRPGLPAPVGIEQPGRFVLDPTGPVPPAGGRDR